MKKQKRGGTKYPMVKTEREIEKGSILRANELWRPMGEEEGGSPHQFILKKRKRAHREKKSLLGGMGS